MLYSASSPILFLFELRNFDKFSFGYGSSSSLVRLLKVLSMNCISMLSTLSWAGRDSNTLWFLSLIPGAENFLPPCGLGVESYFRGVRLVAKFLLYENGWFLVINGFWFSVLSFECMLFVAACWPLFVVRALPWNLMNEGLLAVAIFALLRWVDKFETLLPASNFKLWKPGLFLSLVGLVRLISVIILSDYKKVLLLFN